MIRLDGANALTLDSYLRALGFLALVERANPQVRAWWDERQVLRLSGATLDELLPAVVEQVLEPAGVENEVATPWRGKAGKGRSYVAIRNAAAEEQLDWFDACAVPLFADGGAGDGGGEDERSDKRDNPLLGQGGGFGNAKLAPAFQEALTRLRRNAEDPSVLIEGLTAVLTARSVEPRIARRLALRNKVLGVYQSGRGTGPGASRNDKQPTGQAAMTSAWDVVLVLVGVRLFQGVTTRRPQPGAAVQASFPLLVRARPVGLDDVNDVQLREDDDRAYEFLAPLWSRPARPTTIRHLLRAVRVRVDGGTVARDSLEALMAHAARGGRDVGFDRLVRFTLVAPSDPRYRFAVRRGTITARGSRASALALQEVVPWLRAVEQRITLEQASATVRRAHRDLLNAIAALGGPEETPGRVQDMLLRLVELERALAPVLGGNGSSRPLNAPPLGPRWRSLADDDSTEWRLGLALSGRYPASQRADEVESSWLRHALLPQVPETGRWRVGGSHRVPDLPRASDPLRLLVEACLRELRAQHFERARGSIRPRDLLRLLGGAAEPARVTARVIAAASLPRAVRDARPSGADAALPFGAVVATLLLAAQPDGDEDPEPAQERLAELVARTLAGRADLALGIASRELWRRGLEFAPWAPDPAITRIAPARLALALLLPLHEATCDALRVAVDPQLHAEKEEIA